MLRLRRMALLRAVQLEPDVVSSVKLRRCSTGRRSGFRAETALVQGVSRHSNVDFVWLELVLPCGSCLPVLRMLFIAASHGSLKISHADVLCSVQKHMNLDKLPSPSSCKTLSLKQSLSSLALLRSFVLNISHGEVL